MLSIEDIKNVSFRRANFGGYKPEDVDTFIDDIQISYEEMMRENENLRLTVSKLNQKIDKFYEEDNSIKNVILNAQRIAEKALEDAKNKTTDMMHKAVGASEKMISDAKKEASIHGEISERLKSEAAKLRKQLEDIYTKHKEIIDSIPHGFSKDEKKEIPEPVNIFSDKENISAKVNDQSAVISTKDSPQSFFEKDTENILGGSSETNVKDIFSSVELEQPHRKFKNLKFGQNYSEEEEKQQQQSSSSGIYSGIFRK